MVHDPGTRGKDRKVRISLLLAREPFGEILERTLGPFLESFSGRPQKVYWRAGRVRGRVQGQVWLCNPYLNAIFTPQARPEVFEPVLREYGRSTRRSLRALQRLYVKAATHPAGASWLAPQRVIISPGVEPAGELLFMGGNHRLRLLWPAKRQAFAIHKQGFPQGFMRGELAFRRSPEAEILPIPRLRVIGPKEAWFEEDYISATPLNRLSNTKTAARALDKALEALRKLTQQTLAEESLTDYTSRRLGEINHLLPQVSCLAEERRKRLTDQARTLAGLAERLFASAQAVATAQTHGDFQPGNVLVGQGEVWLVDWEYTQRRQAGYDVFTHALLARTGQGLAGRVVGLLAGRANDRSALLDNWPGLDWSGSKARAANLTLFFLEDLALRLEENLGPGLVRPDPGLANMPGELDQVLVGLENYV